MFHRCAPAAAIAGVLFSILVATTARGEESEHRGKPSPDEIIARLTEGNDRFRTGLAVHPHTGFARLSQAGADDQADHALATILACSDSHAPVERIFDAGVMDLFVVRVAGNVCDTDEIGSIEYGLAHVKTPVLVVMGHTQCGAVSAAARLAKGARLDLETNIPPLIEKIRPAVDRAIAAGDDDLIPRAIAENVWQSIEDLLRRSPETRALAESGRVKIVGAVYDVATGAVSWLPEERPLDIIAAVAAAPPLSPTTPANIPPAPAPKPEASGAESLAALASSGAFTKPNLTQVTRQPFGINAGEASSAKLAGAEIPRTVIHQLFWIAVAAMALITALLAWKLAHLKRADGSTVRGMTIGAKLAIPIGAMATLLVIVSAVSVTAKVRSNEAAARLSQMGDQLALVGALKMEVLSAELAIEDFMKSESDEALARYSDYAATAAAHAELLRSKLDDEQDLALVEIIDKHLRQLDALAAEAVAAIDHERAVVDSLLIPTGDRATEILSSLIDNYRAEDDYQRAFEAAVALEHFALARTATQRFLRTADPDQSRHAQHELQLADEYLENLAAAAEQREQRLAIAEVAGAFEFYAYEVGELIDILQRRDRIVDVQMADLTDTIETEGIQLVDHVTDRSYALQSAIESENAASTVKIAAFSVLAVLFGSVVSILVIRALLKTIHSVLAVLRSVAAGDLTQTDQLNLKPKDEIGEIARATDAMAASLTSLLEEVQQSAESLAAASEEIASSAAEMAGGMDNQTRQVTDISAAIEQMSAAINEVADNSRRASGSADQSGDAAENGGRVVQDTIVGMQSINEAVDASSQAVQELGRRGEQIGEIIEVINDIADQTNLLALNAAIEAARAGEHGRGFAVVADEVRKLADRTTKATDEIAESIQAIQSETSQAVERMQAGAQQVEQGVETAGKAGEALSRIVESAREVSSLIQNVAAATDQQSSASTQISQNIESIRAIASEATEGANQASIASTDLSTKAQDMQALVQRFKLKRPPARRTDSTGGARENSHEPANA
jgi:methyl-accepting chemotaxis protein/carbonic anhydrase